MSAGMLNITVYGTEDFDSHKPSSARQLINTTAFIEFSWANVRGYAVCESGVGAMITVDTRREQICGGTPSFMMFPRKKTSSG